MKFLVIGLGSMGKRRVRCLQALNVDVIIGFDPREDRRKEATLKYGITTISSIDEKSISGYDAIIVSTPPDKHSTYAIMAINRHIPVFIEASVIYNDVLAINEFNKDNSLVAPSCTFRFHPLIKDITSIVKSGKYGKITNFSYHSGQYLPDWHPWEKVSDFYVSNRATGGGREIVPFELTWIVDTIGFPKEIKGYFAKTIDIGADIEDTYVSVLRYDNMLGTLIVDVASRYAVRNLVINMERAQIQWKWGESCIKLFEVDSKRWITINQPEFLSESGYNKNIGEQMYIDEIRNFIDAILENKPFPNTIEDDLKVLQLLNDIEKSNGGF